MGIQNSEGLKTLGYIKNATFLHSKNDHKQKNAKTNDSSYHAHDSNSVIQRGDLKKKQLNIVSDEIVHKENALTSYFDEQIFNFIYLREMDIKITVWALSTL